MSEILIHVPTFMKLYIISNFQKIDFNDCNGKVRNGAGLATSLPTTQILELTTKQIDVVAIMTTARTSCQQERANMEFVTIRPSQGKISGDVD